MNQTDADLMIARAQIGIALLFGVAFIGVLFTLIFFYSNLNAAANTLLSGLTGALVTIVTQQSAFFFARQRPQALPDPTQTTTTITSPPGATTSAQTTISPPPASPTV